MGDVQATCTPGYMDPADSWGTLGVHVVSARRPPDTREGGAVALLM